MSVCLYVCKLYGLVRNVVYCILARHDGVCGLSLGCEDAPLRPFVAAQLRWVKVSGYIPYRNLIVLCIESNDSIFTQ